MSYLCHNFAGVFGGDVTSHQEV